MYNFSGKKSYGCLHAFLALLENQHLSPQHSDVRDENEIAVAAEEEEKQVNSTEINLLGSHSHFTCFTQTNYGYAHTKKKKTNIHFLLSYPEKQGLIHRLYMGFQCTQVNILLHNEINIEIISLFIFLSVGMYVPFASKKLGLIALSLKHYIC